MKNKGYIKDKQCGIIKENKKIIKLLVVAVVLLAATLIITWIRMFM